ncbi:hypothetical protein GCM10010298_54470 [Streptomyces microflavus]|uniref:Uncharacterized protein n=1 Tax=Streptomyces microflavus TaxID=1919 RepID=A0A7J0CVZ2_STRMI|nr:hypothetical protein Smic_51590 [Streptomyces microflavus]GGX82109.1 hypothetical protein GCM10010298_54470 [Streptomyces microflavus]
MTATSADDGCGGRVIRVIGRAEGATESVDGLALEAESYVGVDAGGDADVGVAEEFLDDDEVDALFQEQGRGRVSKVVEADGPELRAVEETAEAAGEVGGIERSTGGGGKTSPLSVQPVPAAPRSSNCGSWWALRELMHSVGRAMRRSEARVLV